MNCQAIVDDWDKLSYYAPMQRIRSPGSKPCSRKGIETVKHLCLCKTHARMARKGFLSETGRVAPAADRSAAQDKGLLLNTWAKDSSPER